MDKPAVADKFIHKNRVRRSRTSDGETVSKRASSSDQSDYRDGRLVAEGARSEIGFASEKENARGGASISSSAAIAKSESKRKRKGVSRGIARQMDSDDEPRAFPSGIPPAPKHVAPEAPVRTAISEESEMADFAGKAASDESRESIKTLYQRGVVQYRSGNYLGAISDLSRIANRDDARELRPHTLFYLARSYQASGQCSLAVRNYQLLISGFPRHTQTGPAMLEAASCLRRLGKIEEARELLERASLNPSVAEQARRELISLE